MWEYNQKTGQLSHNGKPIYIGYSGHGEGLNNPYKQSIPDVGPIPVGKWFIGAPYDSDKIGPYALPLQPHQDTDTFGRSYFRFHGDKKVGPVHQASHGCLIFPRSIREMIHESCDNDLTVVSGLDPDA